MRVLVTADAVGGVWQYSLDLARGLSSLTIETVLAVMGPSPSRSQREEAEALPLLSLVDTGLPLDWLAKDAAALEEAGAAIARLASERQADVLHLNMPALAARGGFDLPVVAVQHSCVATWWEAVRGGELPSDFAWRTEFVRAGLHNADAVVAPTAAFAEATRLAYDLPERPRTVLNGRSAMAAEPQPPQDFVFTAGRLWDEGKDIATLDAAARDLLLPVFAAGPLAGPNGASASFDNIRCLGQIGEDELAQRLSARPIFVSAALYEPFGLAVLEAAAAGCPLILSDIPTFRELWDEVAVFVPPRDADALAAAIKALVGDDVERAVMGGAAQERAARYTPDAMAAQMAAIYRGLLPEVRRPILAAQVAA